MTYDPQTGKITPYVPSGETYSGPPSAYTQFPDMPMPKLISEPVKFPGYAGVPEFTFDYAAEQQKAFEQLKPFYDKLLNFAGGRLDLALRILDYSYQQGMREASSSHELSTREQAITFPQEQEAKQTEQNRRRILESGFGGTERKRLDESQTLRREAVDRALKERESRLGSEFGFGKEEKYRGFDEERFGLMREKQQEALGMAGQKFGIQSGIYQANIGAATAEEAKRAREAANAGYSGGGGGSVDLAGKDDRWLREHGYQSYIDSRS